MLTMNQPVFGQSTNLINLTNPVSSEAQLVSSNQIQIVELERKACLKRYTNTISNNVCPLTWDGLMCWPETPAGDQARLPCPSYINVFDKNETATRDCTLNGSWFVKESTNQSWTDYTRCQLTIYPTNDQIDDHLHHIKLMSKIGYSVSLITLIIAFLILFCNKRLQCPRNHLHLQLFLSFISRSLLTHVKNIFFTLEDNSTLSCKLIIVVWQYSLLANYNWLLMEGLYLHNLVFFNIFNDNSSIIKYIVLGWSLPVLFIIPWIFARSLYEDTNCWVINENVALFWIIRGPITISIILNLIFFINITRVLFLKMFSSSSVAQASRCYKYSKWFKSTLVLVPLFGVHYALLLIANWLASISHTIEIVWLYVDQLFTSFQGFFVALLYCFLNGEVQQEMKKWLRQASQQDRGLQSSNSMTYNSILTQSMSYLNRGRNDGTTVYNNDNCYNNGIRKESMKTSTLIIDDKSDKITHPILVSSSADHLTPPPMEEKDGQEGEGGNGTI